MLSLGLTSYTLAAGAFLVLTLLLITGWEGRAQGVRLILACGVTACWSALFAAGAQVVVLSAPLVLLAEFLRFGAWFIVLTGLTGEAGVARPLSRIVHIVWGGGAILLVAAPVLARLGLPLPNPVGTLAGAGLVMALLGLILLEQIYRNASESGRFALKFFVIAVGVMFAYDLYVYSQAQLIKAIEPTSWDARGFVMLLMVPLLAISARRNPQWSLNIFVSRHVVFYSTSFIVIGAYLLLMAFGGYLVRLYGGTWGRAAQLVFFAGAGVMLLVLVASSNLRRRLRVFLSKHFYRNKYDYRVEWLRFIQTLSQPEEGVDTRDNAVRAMAEIIGSPGGLFFLRTEGGGDYKVAAEWPPGEVDRKSLPVILAADEMAGFLQRQQWLIDLRELRQSPDAYQNLTPPKFLGGGQDRFRLVVPLLHADDLIGFAALASPPEPFQPNYEDRDLLRTVGRHVAVHMAQFEADRQLAESRQFEAYNRLTAFVMHDLKNLAAQLALIVSNAEKHKRNPAFVDDAISTIANSTDRMQRLIQQLQRREMQSVKRRVSLAEIARRAAERCQARLPRPACSGIDEDVWVEADPEQLTMIVEHIIRNAQDASNEVGAVDVVVSVDGAAGADQAVPVGETSNRLTVPVGAITVIDAGAGMSAEFVRERLFKPFDTTKGSKGMGIGAYQAREYVRSIGGRVDVASAEGHGTRFTLRVPLAGPPEFAPEADDGPAGNPH